jgi:hypothetical protein
VSIRQLDYEETLAELMGFVGMVVAVSISHAESEFMGGTFVGRLRSARDADVAALVPELEGDFAGETMHFLLGQPGEGGSGTFAIWRPGFEWGRRVEHPHGHVISIQVAGLGIRIRPLETLLKSAPER